MKILATLLTLSGTCLLTACVSPIAMTTQHNTVFPENEYSSLRSLPNYQANQVKLVEVGQHKDQVRQILGNPHFYEGIFSPKVWNYALGLKLQKNGDYENCRLRIDFDKDNRVQTLTWKDKVCSDVVYRD